MPFAITNWRFRCPTFRKKLLTFSQLRYTPLPLIYWNLWPSIKIGFDLWGSTACGKILRRKELGGWVKCQRTCLKPIAFADGRVCVKTTKVGNTLGSALNLCLTERARR